jgi:hypothetical protein
MGFSDFAKDFSRGCLIDFLLGIAVMIVLGGSVYYSGFSTPVVIVAVWLALAGLLFIPWDEKQDRSRNPRVDDGGRNRK